MKTISLELSKKLNEAGVLDGVETEYFYEQYKRYVGDAEVKNGDDYILCGPDDATFCEGQDFKTLTLEEAIDFISKNIGIKGRMYIELQLSKYTYDLFSAVELFNLSFAEQILTYLLDNNLLKGKQ